jgi:hypothetical protein
MLDFRTTLAAAVLALFSTPVFARDYPVKVTAARVGLPPGNPTDRDESGQPAHVSKFACWAPVYVGLDIVNPVNEPAELAIETADPDEASTTLAVPINLAGRSGPISLTDLGQFGYVRPAGIGEVMITVRAANGGKALSEPFRLRSVRPRDPLTYVVLSLGAAPSGFELPKPAGVAPDTSAGIRGGRVVLSAITDVALLPDHWFGYGAADLIVLHTDRSALAFLNTLYGEAALPAAKTKRAALAEWVRRGGRLVVTVGENAQEVSRWSALQELLPFDVNGVHEHDKLALYWGARESSQTSLFSGALVVKEGRFRIANLVAKADHPARVLIPPPDRRGEKDEIIAGQSAFGLGRVTVIAFDLDQPPFTEFGHRPEFWDWVLREGGADRASVGSEGKPKPGGSNLTEEEDELAVALRTHTDTFEGVPVVSFGWIALLIVLYILLIGPVEYFFLKRVLGRLELTWITFPIIVLTVSLAAYFTAYSLKGRELKINKVDVVDVDPASGRVYGTTWFTIFSPRIDNYTIGVTSGDGWSTNQEPSGTTVSWVGAPRGGRASLLRRNYRYHSDAGSIADGLEKVPVQVWSTKSFTANWSAPIESDRFNPDGNDPLNRPLEHPKDPALAGGVTGTFVCRLPVPVLSDCVAFYAGKAYPLPGGTIRSGETVRLVFDGGIPASDWLKKEAKLEELRLLAPTPADRPGAGKAAGPQVNPVINDRSLPLFGILFHEAALTYGEGVIPRNASLRRLDQSWRLTPDNRSEVILVGRAVPPAGPAESTLGGTDSPSRLWLRGLPGNGERAAIPGTGRQETWVRVYLPIR